MTEIPEKKEEQTWGNYFLERLKERGIDAKINGFVFRQDLANEPPVYVCKVCNIPEVELALGFYWDTDADAFPEKLDDLREVPNLKYAGDVVIRLNDSKDDYAYLQVFDDADKACDLDYKGRLEDILSEDMPAAQIMCRLADYVKQRQGEEQK